MFRNRFLAIFAALLSLVALPIKGETIDADATACGRAPLCCGDFGLMVKGGAAPAIFSHRGQSYVTATGVPAEITFPGDLPEFFKQFQTPWTVGAEFAWSASQRIQFLLEYAYVQAGGKLRADVVAGIAFSEQLSDFKMHAGYLGVRYYFDCLNCCLGCGPIAPYVGFKAGLAWQEQVVSNNSLTGVQVATGVPYYLSQTAVSGGVQVGAEWWFCCCWSLLLQGELVATQGPAGNPNIVTNGAALGVTSLTIGDTRWVVTLPVTLGLRWTF